MSAAPNASAEAIQAAALQQHQAGHLEQAEAGYRAVLTAQPEHPGANHFLGLIAFQTGRNDTAVVLMEKSIAADGRNPTYHQNLGCALKALGRLDDAVAAYRRSIELRPNYGGAHYNLGNALKALDRPDEALAAYRRAVAVDPTNRGALFNLGVMLSVKGDCEEAVAILRRALELEPGDADVCNHLGATLATLGRFEEAETACLRAVELNPDYASAYCTLGNVRFELAKIDQAIDAYDRAVALDPDNGEAHQNLGISLLLAGRLEEGWAEYEWRRKLEHATSLPLNLDKPVWDGTQADGRTIVLQAEQGLGDTIQFVRFVPMVAARCGRVVLQCPAPLVGLLDGAEGVDEVVAYGAPLPDFDCHVSLVSLPRVFGVTLDTLPADVPYLAVDTKIAAAWRERLGGSEAIKVGLVWAGNPRHENDRNRSLALRQLLPLLRTPGVSFFSLQVGERSSELAELTDVPIRDLSPLLTDFTETAGAVSGLDLVVSVDTSVGHLAAALGRPTWLLLPFIPDWRWMIGRDDSPWYPTMRLFRQHARGAWGPVIERLADELQALRETGCGGP